MNPFDNVPLDYAALNAHGVERLSDVAYRSMSQGITRAVNRHLGLGQSVAIWTDKGMVLFSPNNHRNPISAHCP